MPDIPHIALLRAVMDAYEQAFSIVDGVTIDEVHGRDVVMIRGTGRSPTLHGIQLEWTHRMTDLVRRKPGANEEYRTFIMTAVEAAMDGDAGAASELFGLGLLDPDWDLVDMQAKRLGAARGMNLDLVTPPTRERILADRTVMDTLPFAHVAVDRYTVELTERTILDSTGRLPARKIVKRQLVSLLGHVHEQLAVDGHVLQADQIADVPFETAIADRPLQSERRLLVNLPMPSGGGTHFDGETLVLLKALPHTAQAAAIGRQLGEVVETGTPLDRRRILDVDHYEMGRTDLVLEMDAVSLDTI